MGFAIQCKRKELNLLQKELAGMLGVSKDSLKAWENNWAIPKGNNFGKIVAFLEG